MFRKTISHQGSVSSNRFDSISSVIYQKQIFHVKYFDKYLSKYGRWRKEGKWEGESEIVSFPSQTNSNRNT